MPIIPPAESIPRELRELRHWICWKWGERDGKPTKVPCAPDGGPTGTTVTWRHTWTSFEAAVAAVTRKGFEGVGFVFTDTPYAGVDLDWKPDEGGAHGAVFLDDEAVPTAWAADVLSLLPGAYAEVSQSGNGLHVICRGELPHRPGERPDRFRRGQFEMYDATSPRYFATTGRALDLTATTDPLPDLTPALAVLFKRFLSDETESVQSSLLDRNRPAPENGASPASTVTSPEPQSADDVKALAAQLIESAASSPEAQRFFALHDGGAEAERDRSRADYDEACTLWRQPGATEDAVVEAMGASALLRDKWHTRRGGVSLLRWTVRSAIKRLIAEAWIEAIREDRHRSTPTIGTPAAPEPVFSESFTALHAATIEGSPWLVKDIWHAGDRGWIAGEAKVGKTWLAMEMAVAVATGTPFLRQWPTGAPQRVLYLTEESSREKIRERIRMIARSAPHRASNGRGWGRRLHVVHRQHVRLDVPTSRDAVLARVRRFQPTLVIIDPLRRYHVAEEKDSTAMQPTLDAIASIQDLGTAVVVVHHMRKSSEANEGARAGQQLRGSSDFHAWSDAGLYAAGIKGSKAMEVGHELKDDEDVGTFTVTPSFAKRDPALHREATVTWSVKLGETREDLKIAAAADKIEEALAKLRGGKRLKSQSKVKSAAHVGNLVGDALELLIEQGRANKTDDGYALGPSTVAANLDENEENR